MGPVEPESGLGKWLAWASDHVDRSDPLKRLRRRRGEPLTLYCYDYYGDVEQHGFSEPESHSWEPDNPKPGIKLTDRPPEPGSYHDPMKIVIPEDVALPYEWPQESDW